MRLGYACINQYLNNLDPKITTNRRITKGKLEQRGGYDKLSARVLQNVKDLNRILKWNEAHDIRFFRMSSDIISFQGQIDLERLCDLEDIKRELVKAGLFAKENGHRLTMHPSHFNVLASTSKEVVESAIVELTAHADFMDMMGLSHTPFNSLNIHVWASYGNKKETLKRFRTHFEYLPKRVTDRLTIENDDRPSLYNIEDLYEGVHVPLGVPVVLDYLHFEFVETQYNLEQAFLEAKNTWDDIRQLVHYSEGVKDSSGKISKSHTYFIENKIPVFDQDVDIMIEAKGKEQALLSYRKKYEPDEDQYYPF